MSKGYKYFSITDYEWLQSTGDASRIIINYSIADDVNGTINRLDKYIIVKLSRNAEMEASFDSLADKAEAIIAFIQNKIEAAIIENNELPSEITITTYENGFPPNIDDIDLAIEKWKEVVIEKRIGFL
jgi:hypothetical protein